MNIKIATASHLPDIRQLLEKAHLPTIDIENLVGQIFVIELEGKVVASGAFEYYPPLALLRSVVVDESYRGQGLGSKLVSHILEVLNTMQVEAVYLLTQTAESFFQTKFRFIPITRQEVPQIVQQSSEFKEILCQNAKCMFRKLTPL